MDLLDPGTEHKLNGPSRFVSMVPILLLTAAALAVIFACEQFPSQDGPIHLYYADVMRNLLEGTGIYGDAYAINHYISPYSLQTYFLLAFTSIFEPILADKLMLSVCLLLYIFGFRYLVQTVRPGDEVGPILALPFTFTFFVYTGSYNLCLSVGLALWVIGFWIRHSLELTPKRSLQFAGLMFLLVTAHPVSYGLTLLFCGIHVVVTVASSSGSLRERVDHVLRPVYHLCAAAAPIAWIATFITHDSKAGINTTEVKQRILDYLMMWAISPVKSRSYRYSLLLVLLTCGIAAARELWQFLRKRQQARPPALFVFGVLCMAVALFSPTRVSGGTNIGTRCYLIGVILTIAAGAAAPVAPRLRMAAAVVAGCMSLAFFVQLHSINVQVNEDLRVYREAPVAERGAHIAFMIAEGWTPDHPDLSVISHYWLATYYMLRSKAIFANHGFLYLTYMNLKSAHEGKCQGLDPATLPDRPPMGKCLADVANDPDRPRIDVLISTIPEGAAVAGAYGLHRLPYSTEKVQFFGR